MPKQVDHLKGWLDAVILKMEEKLIKSSEDHISYLFTLEDHVGGELRSWISARDRFQRATSDLGAHHQPSAPANYQNPQLHDFNDNTTTTMPKEVKQRSGPYYHCLKFKIIIMLTAM